MYPDQHPLQYIAIISFIFALLNAVWIVAVRKKFSQKMKWLQITFIAFLSALISCVLCGMLWIYHDMQAGYFPSHDAMIAYLKWGAVQGFFLGPLIVAFSIPMNLLSFLIIYKIASFTQRIFST
ncbi:MAG: hypothetical protein KBD00_02690 [Candidatus Peribacteraceae bacterium]|nr:hypothetical protein [Candidatus Peribacteraceae bacterium]